MWGWKTVERQISPAMPVADARSRLEDEGFALQSGDSQHATFIREGTRVTTDGQKFPVELAIAATESGLIMHLRYRSFVLFDTGDLEEFGDELAGMLQSSGN
jgi:hypothetical protein